MQKKANVHIGKIICQKIKEDGRTKKWLAQQIGCDPSNLCKHLSNRSIHIDLLIKISAAMKYNFFEDIAAYCTEKQGNCTPA